MKVHRLKNSLPTVGVVVPFTLATIAFTACQLVPMGEKPRTKLAAIEAAAPPDRGFDVEHYSIELVLYPERRAIEATCRVSFLPIVQGNEHLETVDLDLVGLDVMNVHDGDGVPLDYIHDGATLRIELDAPLAAAEAGEVVVSYKGQPSTGLWFSGTRPDGSGPTQVFTQGQAENNRGWFPCFDHPSDRATSELRVTMPPNWIAVAPGDRIDTVSDGGSRIEHWRMTTPHPSYLVSLVAGEFVVAESEWEGIPLQFMAEPHYRKWLEKSFEETDEILTFMSDYTGIRYPYSKYSQVCVAEFPSGGMENISATTLTPLTLGDERLLRDRTSTALVAHEAAHQWFGDLFTCNDWSHLWLNEGFATYMTMLYFEETRGDDEFRILVRNAQDAYVAEDRGSARRETVTTNWSDPEDLFDTRTYQGAAARLHLLRFIVGDEDFRAGVRTYAAENAGNNVVTSDLEAAMEKVSGKTLDDFFDQWIYGRGFPEFEIAWKWDERADVVKLDVRQVQSPIDGTPSAFRVPVDVEVFDETGSTIHRISLTRRNQSFELPATAAPAYVAFDKYGWIPKTVAFKRPSGAWRIMAHEDDDVNARRDAVRYLGAEAEKFRVSSRATDSQKSIVAALVHRLRRDKSVHVRVASATALGRAMGVEAREHLITAAQGDESAAVRVAALDALGAFGKSNETADVARAAFDEGYSWGTMGAAAGLLCVAEPLHAYTWVTQTLYTDSPHDVLREALFAHLAKLPNPGVSQQLRSWANDESVHPNARAAALRQLSGRRRELVENSRFLTSYLSTENVRMRRAAVQALADLSDDNARKALRAYHPKASAGERRIIEAALSGRRN
jgi:aminopeptidase N